MVSPRLCAETDQVVAAIKSAKAYKYAYEAQDAAQEWADFFLGGLNLADKAGCPSLIQMPSKDELIKKAFGPLSNAADEVIPGGMRYESLPCPKKGCRGCKGPKCSGSKASDDSHGGSKTGGQPGSSTMHSQAQQSHGTLKTRASPTKSLARSTLSRFVAMHTSTAGCQGLAGR
jgi:hypothetical protein